MCQDNNLIKKNTNTKTIWIVSHYSMPPQYETRVKTLKYAEYLQKNGFKVLLFTASTLHNTNINLVNKHQKYVIKKYDELTYVHIYCHNYNNNGLKRIYNMQEFVYKFKKYSKQFQSPDLILAADMNCTNYYPIFKYCKNHNIPMIIDIRDLWPESIVEYLGYSKNNPIIKYLYWKEKRMYQNVDYSIISVEGGKDYILEKHWEKSIEINKIKYINNGVCLKEFYESIKKNVFNDKDLESDDFKIIYTGSIRKANELDRVISVANNLKSMGENNIKFIIFGDGPERERLETLAIEKKLNVTFKGTVDKKYIPYILSKADCTILTYKKSNMFRFGGSQNKLFEYIAAGKPIISNVNMAYNLILKYNLGQVVDNDTEFINACLFYSKRDNSDIKKRSKEIIIEFDFDNLCKKLLTYINELI